MRYAKIVCTVGPSSATLGAIEDLAAGGMSVARVNASHGDAEELAELLQMVRQVDERTPAPLATVLDLQGPEIRTTEPPSPLTIEAEDELLLEPDAETTGKTIGLSQAIEGVHRDDRILLDDGRITLTVRGVEGTSVRVRAENAGALRSRTGVNVPDVDLDLEMVTEKDRADLAVAASGDVDFVAASFVRNAEDVYAVSAALEEIDEDVPIIAKIERADAVANLDGIVDAAYAVMVARGDLGVECPMEDVPLIQKRIIRRCHATGTPVITATEMLESMITASRPTRAEASDVANAVLDGTDAVMLSAETAVGDHPVLAVEAMDRIIREVEASDEYAELREQRVPPASESRTDALARAGRYLARDLGASAIVAASESGYTARKTAKYRPGVPIVAVTLSPRVHRRLSISWGLRPHLVDRADPTATGVVSDGIRTTISEGVAESGETVVVITGMMREIEDAQLTNTLKVHVAAETLATGRVVVPGRATGDAFHTTDGDLTAAPTGAVVLLPRNFDAEFEGDVSRMAGFVSAEPGLTGYAAMIARELDIPMISGASLVEEVPADSTVTLDAERGVLYEGDIARPGLSAEPDRWD